MSEKTPVKGYRNLTEAELALINEGKELAVTVGAYIDRLMADPATDKRWVSIGKTTLQQGFMSAIRGIAQPETF